MRYFALLLTLPLLAQSDEAAFRRMQSSKLQVTEYLINRASAITKKASIELTSRESWEPVRAKRLDACTSHHAIRSTVILLIFAWDCLELFAFLRLFFELNFDGLRFVLFE